MQAILSIHQKLACALSPTVEDVLHRHVVAAAESLTVIMPKLPGNVGVPELITVVHVGTAMVLNIPPGSLDAILEAPPRILSEFLRWRIPSTRTLPIRSRRWWR